jgi:hypothetical protein
MALIFLDLTKDATYFNLTILEILSYLLLVYIYF